MPLPGTLNVDTWKGATWHVLLTWFDDDAQTEPHDLTDHSVALTIYDRSGLPIKTLTETDGIVLGGAAGTLLITLQTETITWREATYDLLVTDPSGQLITPLLSGDFDLEWVK